MFMVGNVNIHLYTNQDNIQWDREWYKVNFVIIKLFSCALNSNQKQITRQMKSQTDQDVMLHMHKHSSRNSVLGIAIFPSHQWARPHDHTKHDEVEWDHCPPWNSSDEQQYEVWLRLDELDQVVALLSPCGSCIYGRQWDYDATCAQQNVPQHAKIHVNGKHVSAFPVQR